MTNPTQRIHEILDHGEAIEKAANLPAVGKATGRVAWLSLSDLRDVFADYSCGMFSLGRCIERVNELLEARYGPTIAHARTSEPRLRAALRVAVEALSYIAEDASDFAGQLSREALASVLAALEGEKNG